MVEIKSYDVSQFNKPRVGDLRQMMERLVKPGDGFEIAGHERIGTARVTAGRFSRKNGVRIAVRKHGDNTLIVRTA